MKRRRKRQSIEEGAQHDCVQIYIVVVFCTIIKPSWWWWWLSLMLMVYNMYNRRSIIDDNHWKQKQFYDWSRRSRLWMSIDTWMVMQYDCTHDRMIFIHSPQHYCRTCPHCRYTPFLMHWLLGLWINSNTTSSWDTGNGKECASDSFLCTVNTPV